MLSAERGARSAELRCSAFRAPRSALVTAGYLFGTTRTIHFPLPFDEYVAIASGVSLSWPAQNGQEMSEALVAASTNSFGRPPRSPPIITQRRDSGSWRN